jgi:hypothetical protein
MPENLNLVQYVLAHSQLPSKVPGACAPAAEFIQFAVIQEFEIIVFQFQANDQLAITPVHQDRIW